MFCRVISCFICISVAVAIPTAYTDHDSITESSSREPVLEGKKTTTIDPGALLDAVTVTATTESRTTLRTQPPNDHSGNTWTPATTLPPTTLQATANLDDLDDISVALLRNLSEAEKGRRLIEAAKNGSVDELRALLVAGADVGARDEYRETPLHWAAYWGHVDAGKCLLEAGAELEARNSVQSTPLHCAGGNGHAAVVRLLVASSVYHSPRNQWGRTPLHYAAIYGYEEAARALLEAGADKGVADQWGDTPLDDATFMRHQKLIDMLTSD